MDSTVRIIPKLYDFIKWSINRISKFPRDQKFLLGDRIENLLFDILEFLIEAVYTKHKKAILKKANLNLEKLRYYLRLTHDFRYMSTKQYEYACREVEEIGKMIGGWIKYKGENV